jgi:hypothetical protein
VKYIVEHPVGWTAGASGTVGTWRLDQETAVTGTTVSLISIGKVLGDLRNCVVNKFLAR